MMEQTTGCGAAQGESATRGKAPGFVTGAMTVAGRSVPVVSTRLSARDVLGAWKVRCDIGRMHYTVQPGLYAVGTPTPESPVLVTANYKLTFDKVRKELDSISAWLLVLDTKGVNVWCAAGKGTFGTRELERRILAVRLDQVVSHRIVILPQLGASGVVAHEVEEASGFRVKYGPVRASDLPAYLAAGMRKTEAMRLVWFRLADRMAIAPAELMHAWPFMLAALAASALFALPPGAGSLPRFLSLFVPLIGAVIVGAVAFPALLPYIPFRAFALKGAALGAAWAIIAAFVEGASLPVAGALVLLSTPIVSFLSMNFTGSSTFTCQPGAALEVRRGIIPMAATEVVGIGLAVTVRLLAL